MDRIFRTIVSCRDFCLRRRVRRGELPELLGQFLQEIGDALFRTYGEDKSRAGAQSILAGVKSPDFLGGNAAHLVGDSTDVESERILRTQNMAEQLIKVGVFALAALFLIVDRSGLNQCPGFGGCIRNNGKVVELSFGFDVGEIRVIQGVEQRMELFEKVVSAGGG